MKRVSLSIGIPAYNEELNIKKLLLSLLSQENNSFNLREIIVVSDCSEDNTILEIKSIHNNKIRLIQNRKRSGQSVGQNKIIKLFSSDILILLNADVLPNDKHFLEEIIKPFSNPKVGLVGPKIIPTKAHNFFEEIINLSIILKESIFENWNNGSNIYLCSGRGRAFSRELAKKIYWTESLSEDAYSYLFCIENSYEFRYSAKARLLFKSPDNFKDHIKQSARFMSGSNVMCNYFPNKLVKRSYSIPLSKTFIPCIRVLVNEPILFISYIFTVLIIKLNPNKRKYATSKWQASSSSKSLDLHL